MSKQINFLICKENCTEYPSFTELDMISSLRLRSTFISVFGMHKNRISIATEISPENCFSF